MFKEMCLKESLIRNKIKGTKGVFRQDPTQLILRPVKGKGWRDSIYLNMQKSNILEMWSEEKVKHQPQ